MHLLRGVWSRAVLRHGHAMASELVYKARAFYTTFQGRPVGHGLGAKFGRKANDNRRCRDLPDPDSTQILLQQGPKSRFHGNLERSLWIVGSGPKPTVPRTK